MADNFLQAINTGINLGHMADSAKMQRVQMEQMAVQMQRANDEHLMKVMAFNDARGQQRAMQSIYAPASTKGGGDEYTGPMDEIVPGGPGREALRGQYGEMGDLAATMIYGGMKPTEARAFLPKEAKPQAGFNLNPNETRYEPGPSGPIATVTAPPAPTKPQGEREPSVPMFVDVPVSADTEQKYQWNPVTKTHDIPVGKPRPMYKPSTVNINQITPEQASGEADSIANGRMAPNSFLSKRGVQLVQTRQAVRDKYPDFNFNMAETNYKYMTNSNNLRSMGLAEAVMPRVEALKAKAERLQNLTKIPILDEPMNRARRALGDVPVADFESLRNAVIQEVNTALTGSSTASDFRIRLEMENLKSGMTVRQQMASIDNLMSALEARKDAAYAVPYPWEVVRGETTLDQWKQKQTAQKGIAGGGMNFDPNAINAELKRRGVIK